MIDSPAREPGMADNALGLDMPDAAPAPGPSATGAYRVLARKYRPQTFAELIGQDAIVRTLGNAIARDRLAHAFLMTGVRGVGKTSTARLIAKALNCVGPDGTGGPTIDPCGRCEPCQAITEGRHLDVIEMDAASNTGVDDVREIIEGVRYAALSARYRIYIIDEVHMLSRSAFNALLKTLEEPPPHVKFLFATTEVGKLPVTVLSRCQRFDLRRIEPEMLAGHYARVLEAEGVEAEAEAVRLIAVAADGSVRDGLSILDQAIAQSDLDGDSRVTGDQVRAMLGLSDQRAITDLFGALIEGGADRVFQLTAEQRALGVEPDALVAGLLAEVHGLTLAKVGQIADPTLSEADRERLTATAERVGHGALHRIWQMLLKGHDEVRRAVQPRQALDMLLLRVLHGARMPDPAEVAALLAHGGGAAGAGDAGPAAAARAVGTEAVPRAMTIGTVHDHLDRAGRQRLAALVDQSARVIRLVDGEIVLARDAIWTEATLADLADTLRQATGARWSVTLADGEGAPSLEMQRIAARDAERQALLDTPIVRAAMAAFPDARPLFDHPAFAADHADTPADNHKVH